MKRNLTFILAAALAFPTAAIAQPILAVSQATRPAGDASRPAKTLVYSFTADKYSRLGPVPALPSAFRGGARVGLADIDGDFIPEVVRGAGPGRPPQPVQLFDISSGAVSKSPILAFVPFDVTSRAGVNLGCGYFTLDLQQDIVIGAGKGSSQVKVFDIAGESVVLDFQAFAPNLKGGVFVASADLTADFRSEVIAGAGAGGEPAVRIFDGSNGTMLSEFFAYDQTFRGGVRVATGDVNGDSVPDIFTAPGAGMGPQIRIYDGTNRQFIREFLAYGANFRGGVNIATGDVNGDGCADVITAPGRGKGPVKLFSCGSDTEITSFFPFGKNWTGGAIVYQF